MMKKTDTKNERTLTSKKRMKLTTQAQRLAYILRGKNRRAIYQVLLTDPRTQSEINRKTGIPLSNISRVIDQLEHGTLIENLTPFQSIGALYQLTDLALEFKSEFEKHMRFREKNFTE